MEVNFNLAFNEDAIIKLQKDLNHLLTHLDSQNVKKLYTEYCEIESNEGTLVMEGPVFLMYGDPLTTNSTTVRLFMGWDSTKRSSTGTNNFVFSLFNQSGNPTIELNSCGNAIFSGNVNTSENINIGNNIYLGSSTPSSDMKGIYFNSTIPGSPTSTGGMAYLGTSDGKSGLMWSHNWDAFVLASTGGLDVIARNGITIGLGDGSADITMFSTFAFVPGSYIHYGAYEMLLDASYFIEMDVGINAYWYLSDTGMAEIYSTGKVLINNLASYVSLESTVVEMKSTSPILIGDSTLNNAYIGTSESTQKIATRGYVDSYIQTIVKHTKEVQTTNVLQDDDEFNVTLAAGCLYQIDAALYFIGSSAVDLNLLWVLGGSATWKIGSTYYSARIGHGPGPSASGVTDANFTKVTGLNMGDYPNTVFPYASVGGGSWGPGIMEKFLIRTSSTGTGTFKLQWCLSAAGSTGAALREGSFITISKTNEI